MMELAALSFYIFAIFLLVSGLGVVFSKSPVHSVFFLILSFFNAAGLFVLVGAEFLAMILILVYVGAVAVLFLFVVMMLDGNTESLKKTPMPKWELFFKSSFQISMFFIPTVFIIVLNIYLTSCWYQVLFDQLLEGFWNQPISLFDLYILSSFILSIISGHLVFKQIVSITLLQSFKNFLESFPLNFIIMILIFVEFLVFAFLWGTSITVPEYTSSPTPSIDAISNTDALGRLIYTDYFYAFQMGGMILLVAMIGAIVLTLRQREESIVIPSISDQLSRTKEDTLKLNKVLVGKGINL